MKKTIFICFILLLSLFVFQETTISPATHSTLAYQEPQPDQPEEQAGMGMESLVERVSARSASAVLDVPVIKQLPELYNGCEVTSLAMLLQADGRTVDKMELAERVKKDPTAFIGTSPRNISQWGDPNDGFVGDITGKRKGYGVYHGPLYELLREYVAERAVNLTGRDFAALEWVIDQGHPVVVWTTTGYQPTDQWVTWKKGERSIQATFQEHAVLLVGYDEKHVYINDPLSGVKAHRVPKESFVESWKQMGSQALSIMDQTQGIAFAAKSDQP